MNRGAGSLAMGLAEGLLTISNCNLRVYFGLKLGIAEVSYPQRV